MLIVVRQRQQAIDCLLAAWADHRLDRRAFLRRAVATGVSASMASSLLAGCAGETHASSIDVLNVWSGEELASFRAVVAPFTRATGITINLESTRNLNVALTIRLRGNDPPGVAVVPNPAQMRQMAAENQLIRLDTFLDMRKIRSDYSSDWLDLASYQGNLYALVYKAANKGIIWYSPAHFSAPGYSLPTTWDQLIALSDEIAARGLYPWAMGVESAAASGWPAADWIAEIYLKSAGPQLYDQWVNHQIPWTHESVRQAFATFGRIVGGRHYIAGGPQSILSTSYTVACSQPFATPAQAFMDYLGDFAAGFITSQFPLARPGLDFNFFPFPTLDPRYANAVTGSADLVVAMHDDEAVRQFMTYLSGAGAQSIWVKRGGATSANLAVNLADYPNNVARSSANMLLHAAPFRFGADDLMPFAVEKSFWQQIQLFIADPRRLDDVLTAIEQVARVVYGDI
ncbi:MAG TPA: ABC transporter substrate-binding protein [Ktedonobacteraceae bacterium]|jgi:alpha-glucoside transport system substrate-binding protein